MKVEIRCDSFLREFFAERTSLLQPDVKVEVTDDGVAFESDKFEYCEREKDGVTIWMDESLIEKFEELKPFATVLYDIVNGKPLNARVFVATTYAKYRVTCPFCSRVGEFATAQLPHSYPSKCECGASVAFEVGDDGDVLETLTSWFEDKAFERVGKSEIKSDDGSVVALCVEEPDDEEMGVWIIFWRSARSDAVLTSKTTKMS